MLPDRNWNHDGALSQGAMLIKLIDRGTISIEQRGQQLVGRAGDVIVFNPVERFTETFSDGARLCTLRVPVALLRHNDINDFKAGFTVPASDVSDARLVCELIQWAVRQGPSRPESTKTRMGEQILGMLDLLVTDLPGGAPTRITPALSRAKHFMAKHFANADLSPTMIADAAHITPAHLSKLFRAEHTTLMNYLWELRLRHAMDLLVSDRTPLLHVQTVADRCGFRSHSHMCRLFKQKDGCTPTAVAADR
jgi:AraC-like DNA-binding protein